MVVSGAPLVLYVSGYGRSGSTFLTRLLDQEPGVCGAGELIYFDRWNRAPRPCSCGAPIVECEFWSQVRKLSNQAGSSSRCASLIDSAAALLFGTWWLPADCVKAYGKQQRGLFSGLSAASGCHVIVDSSKSDFRTAGRAVALSRIADLPVKQIHLVRSPQDVWRSLARGTNKELEGRTSGRRRLRRVRAFIGWSWANWAAVRIARRLGPSHAITIRYEEVVSDLEGVLARLGQFVGLPMDSVRSVLFEGATPRSHHMAEGNRMRHQPLVLKAASTSTPTRVDRVLCVLFCGLLCRRFEYSADGRLLESTERAES